MILDIDTDALRKFSDKHCGGKEPDLELLMDMARALGMRASVRLVDRDEE